MGSRGPAVAAADSALLSSLRTRELGLLYSSVVNRARGSGFCQPGIARPESPSAHGCGIVESSVVAGRVIYRSKLPVRARRAVRRDLRRVVVVGKIGDESQPTSRGGRDAAAFLAPQHRGTISGRAGTTKCDRGFPPAATRGASRRWHQTRTRDIRGTPDPPPRRVELPHKHRHKPCLAGRQPDTTQPEENTWVWVRYAAPTFGDPSVEASECDVPRGSAWRVQELNASNCSHGDADIGCHVSKN